MSGTSHCPQCGAETGPEALAQEPCPACLLKLGLGSGAEEDGSTLGLSKSAPGAPGTQVRALQLRCPHCQGSIEIADPSGIDDVVCPSCGSSFRLEAAHVQAQPLSPPRRLARFELQAEIGVGSFGTVYKARDTELDRTVAIKVPRAGRFSSQAEEDRFLREARSAAQLDHPSIVALYDAGRADEHATW